MNTDQKLKQLLNRLQNASTSSDRVDALYDLQGLARSNPAEVGSEATQLVIDLLKDQGSVEEYQECLELMSRLLKHGADGAAAIANANRVVAEKGNVEIFLDLLEHEDGLIGIMASDLLRDIHSLVPMLLETAIHECPAGMNKLLHRVADRSREEVGNQALVLIHQLTLTNEEMKKTVAFNEGFDILFNIIVQEGGISDPGVVVEDCLKVCCNILTESEICQRLFYSMGSSWRHTLVGFFDPEQLENSMKTYLEDEDEPATCWFDQPVRINCAVLAMTALVNSLGLTPSSKHQLILAKEHNGLVLTAATFWCARNGPIELIPLALSLLKYILLNNPDTLQALSSIFLTLRSPKKGVHVPLNYEVAPLAFGHKTSHADDRQLITIPALFAERYVLNDNTALWSSSVRSHEIRTPVLGWRYSNSYLEALDVFLSVDQVMAGMILQHVLAPLAPSPEDGEYEGFDQTDPGKPLGCLILQLLVESCNKILQHLNNTALTVMPNSTDIINAQKCSNVFTLILLHGGALARELASAVHLSHVSNVSSSTGNQPLLSFFLSVIARVVRMPHGYGLTVSLFRMLCAAGAGCETSCRLMLDNPSNLFVVDLAMLATGDESSPILFDVHSYACFFLGTCMQALPAIEGSESTKPKDSFESNTFHVSRKMLLDIVDAKIGLTRFTEILKKRVTLEAKVLAQTAPDESRNHSADILRSANYLAFLSHQREAIRKAIYDHYSGSLPSQNGNNPESIALLKVIELQKEEIERLMTALAAVKRSEPDSGFRLIDSDATTSVSLSQSEATIEQLKSELVSSNEKALSFENKLVSAAENIINLNALVKELQSENSDLRNEIQIDKNSADSWNQERSQWIEKLSTANQTIVDLEAEINILRQKNLSDTAALMESENLISALQDQYIDLDKKMSTTVESLSQEIESLKSAQHPQNTSSEESDQILRLKEQIVALNNEKKKMRDELDKGNRKIELLEEEMKGPVPYEKNRETKIVDLESRNGALKKQIWQLEGELEASKSTAFEGCLKIVKSLSPIFQSIVTDYGDIDLLTFTIDANDNNRVSIEALTAFVCSDIATCQELVDRRLNYIAEYRGAGDVDLSSLKKLITFVSTIIDQNDSQFASRSHQGQDSAVITELRGELDRVLLDLSDRDAMCKALETEVSELRDSMNIKNSISIQSQVEVDAVRASLSTEISTLQKVIESLEGQLAAAIESRQKSDMDIVRYQQNALIHEDELEELKAQCAEFYERTHEHDELLSKFEQMVNDFSLAEEKIAHFNEIVDKLTGDNEMLIVEKQNLLDTVVELEKSVKKLQNDLNYRTEASQLLVEEVAMLKKSVISRDESIVRLEESESRNIGEWKSRVNELELALEQAHLENKEKIKELSEAQPFAVILETLQSERDALKRKVAARDKEFNELTKECIVLSGRCDGYKDSCERLQEELDVITSEKDAFEKECEISNQLIQQLKSANALLSTDMKNKGNEVEELKKFLLMREKELEQKHRLAISQTLALCRSAIQKGFEEKMQSTVAFFEGKLQLVEGKLLDTRNAMSNALRKISKNHHAIRQKNADLKNRIVQLEELLESKESLINKLKRYQNDVLLATKEMLNWASASCNEVLMASGVAPVPSFPRFESIPESFTYMRDQIDAAVDTLLKANVTIAADLKQKQENLVLTQKKLSGLEAEIVEYKSNHPTFQNVDMSTPQHQVRGSRVSFNEQATPGKEKALIISGNGTTSTPLSTGRVSIPGTPSTKEFTKLQSELRRERKRLNKLREQHEELLGLLAQQELELKTFKNRLYDYCGHDIVARAEKDIRQEAIERYGSYIDFRQQDPDYSFDVDVAPVSPAAPRLVQTGNAPYSPQVL